MPRLVFALALVLVLRPGAALAKGGPMAVTIVTDPGVVIEIEEGTAPFERLRTLIEARTPISDPGRIDRLLEARADLGPHVELRWQHGEDEVTTIVLRQDLYPWAAGGPLLFAPPRDGAGRGAWFGIDPTVIELLETVGVGWSPQDGGAGWPAALVATVALAAVLAWNLRRSSGVRVGEGGVT